MTLFVYGFPSEICGLRFEWAWQNPKLSRRLRHLAAKRSKETAYAYRVRIMASMLHTAPWSRLPLNVCWFIDKYKITLNPSPPPHVSVYTDFINASKEVMESQMPTTSSAADVEIIDEDSDNSEDSFITLANKYRKNYVPPPKKVTGVDFCLICKRSLNDGATPCKSASCSARYHFTCLSKHCLRDDQDEMIPIMFDCVDCKITSTWGAYVRGISGIFTKTVPTPSESPFLGENCMKKIKGETW